jgi:hypothetical protein
MRRERSSCVGEPAPLGEIVKSFLGGNRLAALDFGESLVKLGPLLGCHPIVEGIAACGFRKLMNERALVARRQRPEQFDNARGGLGHISNFYHRRHECARKGLLTVSRPRQFVVARLRAPDPIGFPKRRPIGGVRGSLMSDRQQKSY